MSRRRSWELAAACALGLAVAAAVAAAGCAADGEVSERSETRVPEPEDVLSEQLMIPLAQAQNQHHIADVYLKDGNPEEAILAVRKILSLTFPPDAPEAEDVTADARARLGKLLIAQGRLDEAAQVVDEGIAIARRESFFVANLHTVRGAVIAARADAIRATDRAGADALGKQAIEAFAKSNEIHSRVLQKLMQERAP